MGQKIHPGGLRVGVIHDWKSNWYTGKKEFPQYILEDVRIREHIYKKLAHAGLSDILIRKDKQRITVDIYTARPGIVIGKSGVEVDALRKELHAMTQKNVHININEIKRPELDAKLVAQSIAEQLSNRVAFRRAMKRALASAIRSGAAGVKIQCSGRLGGGEMSRRETYNEGRVPLHTIRADIDYGFVEARTASGRIGVKVWINKGEIMPKGFDTAGGDDARLGDQDARRRRGGATEGLGASRESARQRGPDREGLGPVKRRRGPGGAGGGAAGGGAGRGPGGAGGGRSGQRRGPGAGARPAGGGGGGRPASNRPRKQDPKVESGEQPVNEPQVEETTPTPVADAPEATTPEATTPEATTPEATTPEATTPEAATPETGTDEGAES
jgi:small subunit ribosomal protein S3